LPPDRAYWNTGCRTRSRRRHLQSYRDGLCQLLPFVAKRIDKSIDRLNLVDLSVELNPCLLDRYRSDASMCSIAIRNQRVAAVRVFAGLSASIARPHRMVGPDPFDPVQRTNQAVVPTSKKAEIDAVLTAPDRWTEQGRRLRPAAVHVPLQLGVRASEAVGVEMADLNLDAP
jgi:integrase/recombinase XerD